MRCSVSVSSYLQQYNTSIAIFCYLLLVTSASHLPLRTMKFCSVLFVVVVHAAGCDKTRFTNAWWSVQYTNIHANCYKLLHGQPSQMLITLHQSSIRSPNWSKSTIFTYAACIQCPRSIPRWNFAMTFSMENYNGVATQWWICSLVSTNTWTWWTDGHCVIAQPVLMHSIVSQKTIKCNFSHNYISLQVPPPPTESLQTINHC